MAMRTNIEADATHVTITQEDYERFDMAARELEGVAMPELPFPRAIRLVGALMMIGTRQEDEMNVQVCSEDGSVTADKNADGAETTRGVLERFLDDVFIPSTEEKGLLIIHVGDVTATTDSRAGVTFSIMSEERSQADNIA